MTVLGVNVSNPNSDVIDVAADAVRAGKVILYPTDTIYGLGCDAWNGAAVERVFEIKGRPGDKGMLVLVEAPDAVRSLASRIPAAFQPLADRFWPGPVTFLLPAADSLPPPLSGEGGLVGVRCPESIFLRLFLKTCGTPVVSTSANLSGQAVPDSFAELARLFLRKVDLLLDGGEPSGQAASTVVDLSREKPVIVRRGELAEQIEAFLANPAKNEPV